MNLEVSTITFGLPGATITLRSQILNLKLLNESALYKRFTNYSCQCVNVRKEQKDSYWYIVSLPVSLFNQKINRVQPTKTH